jgi:hypothetical protein
MKLWQYTTCVVLSTVCLGLCAVIVFTSHRTMTLQDEMQVRQQQLNNSVLGPQAQQIANSILQDMATSAATNHDMRALLSKYGYVIPAASSVSPDNQPAKKTNKEK